MTRKSPSKLSRRQLLQDGALAGAGLAIGGRLYAVEPQASSLIMKMVPASGCRRWASVPMPSENPIMRT
jgi:hypothetical protein